LLKKWRNSKNLNQAHHAQMENSFVEDIAYALKQYGKAVGYNLNPQFYKDMAWGGLQDQLMNSGIVTPLDQYRITNTIAAENNNASSGVINPVGKKSCN